MSALDPQDADRLAKILGLLGSAHDGERASAALKAHDLIRSRNLTWPDVFATKARNGARRRAPAPELDTVEAKVGFVLANIDVLTLWEEGFLYSINGRRILSIRQLAVLDKLVRKCRAYAASRQ
jgi:hypothetical protein